MTTVTLGNIDSVCGRMKKFFWNNNETGFETWHNFDCGWRNIKPYCERRLIAPPTKIEIDSMFEDTFIRVALSATSTFIVKVGERINFSSNKIIIQSKWNITSYSYVYSIYQCAKMSKKQKDGYYREAENEALMFEQMEVSV